MALADLGQFEAALAAFQRSLTLRPESAETAASLGHFFERKGDLNSAKESYGCAVSLDPNLIKAHLSLGVVLVCLGDRAKAMECFERARQLNPDFADTTFNIGVTHLRQGDFALGWSEYESRWKACVFDRRKLAQPLWKGEPLEGARILLYAEQGLGDTLQFVRYVPQVARREGQVILEVQPRLCRLLSKTEGAWRVIGRGEPLPEFAWRCPLLSLPLAFATELNTIPAQVPYLHPDPELVDAWRRRLKGDSVRIGLAWGAARNIFAMPGDPSPWFSWQV